MTFVRTVLGDIDPAALGVTYAHEHLVIDGGRPVDLLAGLPPERRRAPDRRAAGRGGRRARGRDRHDAGGLRPQPAPPRRAVAAERRPPRRGDRAPPREVHGPAHWSLRATEDELADLFAADVEVGIDERDYTGPIVRRTSIRAGRHQDRRQPRRPVRARPADLPRRRRDPRPDRRPDPHATARPGPAPSSMIGLLADDGVPAERISVTHVDKVVDRGYHRAIFATGASAVYDESFRWGDRENGSAPAPRVGGRGRPPRPGHARDGRRPPALSHARYGGSPGLTYLLREFSDRHGRRAASTPPPGAGSSSTIRPGCSRSRRWAR